MSIAQIPTDATHRSQKNEKFYKFSGELLLVWQSGKWFGSLHKSGDDVALRPLLHQPDALPAWTGEGLPPVGTVCEITTNDGHNWYTWKILFSDNYVVLVGAAEGKANYTMLKRCDADVAFRPIRTPEQIASQKRSDQIQEACRDIGHVVAEHNVNIGISAAMRATVEAMIDAGYAKVVVA